MNNNPTKSLQMLWAIAIKKPGLYGQSAFSHFDFHEDNNSRQYKSCNHLDQNKAWLNDDVKVNDLGIVCLTIIIFIILHSLLSP